MLPHRNTNNKMCHHCADLNIMDDDNTIEHLSVYGGPWHPKCYSEQSNLQKALNNKYNSFVPQKPRKPVYFMALTDEETEAWRDQISKLNWKISDSYHLSKRRDVWSLGFSTKACTFRGFNKLSPLPTGTPRGEKDEEGPSDFTLIPNPLQSFLTIFTNPELSSII